MIQGSKHGYKLIKGAQFAEGLINPNAPVAPTFAGTLGAAASGAKKRIDRNRDK